MKKFTSLLIGCSLALAGAAMAQQPDEQSTPKEKEEKTHGAEAKPGAKAVKPEAAPKTHAAETKSGAKEHGAKTERTTSKALKTEATPKSEKTTGTETNVSGEAATNATPEAKQHGEQHKKGMKAAGANAKATATPAPTAATSATPVTAASASASPTVAAAGQQNAHANTAAAAKKPDPVQVQQIKEQHTNFRAQPRPDKVPAVTFNASYRIQGSDRWQGPQYEVYRSYRPERHDQGWYRSRYNRVELIGGGYYYWNNNYWYPAWGYNPSNEYYAYDAPIYVGHRAEPPDRVIADVQAVLQNMGYYKGEVDGLLGPLTREALAAYQSEQGLTATAVIDEPTLDALGMG